MAGLSGRGLLRGTLASLAGLAAMGAYFKVLSAMSGGGGGNGGSNEQEEGALDDIALLENRSREDESSTETVARLAHQAVTGDEPDEDRKAKLGQAVHWGYGMLVGALYGAVRDASRRDGLDLGSGLGYGAALWLLGDEVAVPVLGLAKGPTAHPTQMHASMLGAHLVYGATTAAANRMLCRVI